MAPLLFLAGGGLLIVFAAFSASCGTIARTRVVSFSPEYLAYINSDVWKRRRRWCFFFTYGRDTLCPWLQATQADHLHYRSMGRELPWFDIVPLNARTHQAVTVARMMFGRGPVNFVLRLAYFLWLSPYVMLVAMVVVAIFPRLWPTIGFAIRANMVNAINAASGYQ